jgi:N-acetylneuraminic acid mutarotase
MLTSSQAISAIPGTYTLVAVPVVVGTSTYNATQITQAVTVTAGATSAAVVDYYDIVPNTTKVLDQTGQESLAVSSDGSTVTISSTSEVAQSLQVGNVLASVPTASAPNGLLVTILSVSNNGSTVVASVSQATLEQAIQRGSFTYTQTFSPSSGQSVVGLVPGSRILTAEQAKREGIRYASDALPNSCSTDSNAFIEPFAYTMGPQIGISSGDTGVAAAGQVQLSGTLEFCPQLQVSAQWDFLTLKSAQAEASFGEHAMITAQGELTVSYTAEEDVAKLTQPVPTVVAIGGVPVALQAQAILYVGSSLNAAASFSANVEQDAQAQAGLAYANGTTTPIQSVTDAIANEGTSLDGPITGNLLFVGFKLGVLVDGFLLPNIATDAYINGTAGPPAALSWGLESNVGLDVSIIDTNIDVGLSSPELNLFSQPIWEESGSFDPSLGSIIPNAANEGGSDVSITLTGANFVPDSVVNFNGIPLSTTFSAPGNMTAVIPASDLLVPGSYPITVTSPDTVGAVSNAVAFTVNGSTSNPVPSITSLLPNSLVAGTKPQELTIDGTGFLASSTVTYNGIAHTPAYVSANQLTISLTSSDLAAAGSYPVVVTNPAPGGGSSAPVDFTVSSTNPVPAITSLSPVSLVAGAAPQTLTINGTGFLTSSTVSFNGIAHTATYVGASQLTLSLTSADLATAGTYPVIVTNPAPGGGTSSAANFIVTNPQIANEWTWINGSSTVGALGVYGTPGVSSASNVPGSRFGACSWTDSNGIFWLFGGYGYASTGSLDPLNDLWMFSPTTVNWTWVSGSSTVGAPAVYGSQGVPATTNVPGARMYSISWIDKNNKLWLFGGEGVGSNNVSGFLDDLWEFDPSAKTWTWVSGNSASGTSGIYGTLGEPSTGNVPGSRYRAVSWIDSKGNLWLFGGDGEDSTGFYGQLNDLWEYSPPANTWTWVSGSKTANVDGVYGTEGIPATTNVPGSRRQATSWIDSSDNLWLFGGSGWNASGSAGGAPLNDLWEFNPTAKTWTWMSGSSTLYTPNNTYSAIGIYGTKGVAAAGNTLGGRTNPVSWVDSSNNLWLFGGNGFDSVATVGELNDLWVFNPSTSEWTWTSGSNTANATGTYGAQDVPTAANVPGSRDYPVGWIDDSGNLWLFGGEGYASTGSFNLLNDLWRYQPSDTAAPSITGVSPLTFTAPLLGQTITIDGSGFQSDDTLTFSPPAGSAIPSIPGNLTYNSRSQFSYQFNDSVFVGGQGLGTWTVTVTNPGGQTSNAWNFTTVCQLCETNP